jgi:pimeloyl-ACP methyl ester carboxylesterase
MNQLYVGGELEQVECPILLIFGEQNSKTGVLRQEMAKAQSKHNQRTTPAFVNNAAHNPMLENLTAFYAILSDFLTIQSAPFRKQACIGSIMRADERSSHES